MKIFLFTVTTNNFNEMFDFFYSRYDRRKVYKQTDRLVMNE